MLIDSHCHLDFPDLAVERDAVIGRARAAGVERMITISTRVGEFAAVRSIAEAYPDVYCTVGDHPDHVHEAPETSVAQLVDLSSHPKCVAIGEAGLDYFHDRAPRDMAGRAFRTHIAAARQSGLPLVIHSREADAEVAAILRDEMDKGPFTAVLHCFTSTAALAETALALGLYISFSGVISFKKADELRSIARFVPIDRLLVETDAPFLAPVPHRGKRNEPAYVADTAKALAEAKGVSLPQLAAATSANAYRLFSKMPPADGGARTS
jgi:TatD DNase family protein